MHTWLVDIVEDFVWFYCASFSSKEWFGLGVMRKAYVKIKIF